VRRQEAIMHTMPRPESAMLSRRRDPASTTATVKDGAQDSSHPSQRTPTPVSSSCNKKSKSPESEDGHQQQQPPPLHQQAQRQAPSVEGKYALSRFNLPQHGSRTSIVDESDDKEWIFSYSCPFRKRNPARFNVRDYERCATSPFYSVSDIK
jgi:hypothetical protein